MADIFISYKSDRRAAAEHLAEILGDYGWSVWWDYELASGQDFGAQIERELRGARAVVVLWCRLSRESEWVKEEAALAKRLGTLVPARIEPVELPLGFSLSQTIDLSDWDGSPGGAPLQRLIAEIERVTGRKARPNRDGLGRTERSWRRYGALPLQAFPLIRPVEPEGPTGASSPSRRAAPSTEEPGGARSQGSLPRALWALATVLALMAGAAVWRGIGWSNSESAAAPVSAPAPVADDAAANAAAAHPPQPAPEEQAAYDAARAARTAARYRRFLAAYPQSMLASDARRRLASCTSSTVRVTPGRRVQSEVTSISGSVESFQAASRDCRAALEAQCPSGVVEHVPPEQWGLAIPLQREADGLPRNISTCYATCYRTRAVETCD